MAIGFKALVWFNSEGAATGDNWCPNFLIKDQNTKEGQILQSLIPLLRVFWVTKTTKLDGFSLRSRAHGVLRRAIAARIAFAEV